MDHLANVKRMAPDIKVQKICVVWFVLTKNVQIWIVIISMCYPHILQGMENGELIERPRSYQTVGRFAFVGFWLSLHKRPFIIRMIPDELAK